MKDIVKEIIYSKPSFGIRWGMTILLLFFCCIILLSRMVKYPEFISLNVKIEGTGELTSKYTGSEIILRSKIPAPMVSKLTGGNEILISIENQQGKELWAKGKIADCKEVEKDSLYKMVVVMDDSLNYNMITEDLNKGEFTVRCKIVCYNKSFFDVILINLKIL